MKKIQIEFIPHNQQRYNTIGDYYEGTNFLHYKISIFKNPAYSLLVLIHELIESFLCQKRGLTIDKIDRFDIKFEKNRKRGDWESEPGDDPKAPYRHEHSIATGIERTLCFVFGEDWNKYEDEAVELQKQYNTRPGIN